MLRRRAFTFEPLERRAVENRLVSVTVNGQTTTFTYDGDGVRVKKVDASGTTYIAGEHYEVKGGVVTKYYYFGGQRVARDIIKSCGSADWRKREKWRILMRVPPTYH